MYCKSPILPSLLTINDTTDEDISQERLRKQSRPIRVNGHEYGRAKTRFERLVLAISIQ